LRIKKAWHHEHRHSGAGRTRQDAKLRPLLFDDGIDQLQIAVAKLAVAVLNQQAALDAVAEHLNVPGAVWLDNLGESQNRLNEVFYTLFENIENA
jgi:hypothetical protein